MNKKILLFGGGAAIILLLVVGSFSIGMFVGGGISEAETPVVSPSSAVNTASKVLQQTLEDNLENKPPQ